MWNMTKWNTHISLFINRSNRYTSASGHSDWEIELYKRTKYVPQVHSVIVVTYTKKIDLRTSIN